jgi:hypothetical protein
LILEKQNLDRMKQADPFDFDCRAYQDAGLRVEHRIRDLDIVIAYEETLTRWWSFTRVKMLPGFCDGSNAGGKIVRRDVLPPPPLRKV